MKTKLLLYIILLFLPVFIACNNKEKSNKDDYEKPLIINKLDLKPNQWVLSPSKSIYDTAIANGFENSVFVFYPRKVINSNDSGVLLDELGDSALIPNYLIIPLPLSQYAKKGDLVLTWWQKGTGMQRAIVLSKELSENPIVYYLDNQFSSYYDRNDLKYSIDTLKKGTFMVVKDSLMQGRTFMVNEDYISNYYIVISYNKDSVVGVSWAGIIKVFQFDKCQFVNTHNIFNVGDSVNVPYLGTYCTGIVKNTWYDIGKMDVVINFLGDSLSTRVNIFDSFKLK